MATRLSPPRYCHAEGCTYELGENNKSGYCWAHRLQNPQCRENHNQSSRRWREKNRQKHRELSKRWYEKQKQKKKEVKEHQK